jgi:hypothetical protein
MQILCVFCICIRFLYHYIFRSYITSSIYVINASVRMHIFKLQHFVSLSFLIDEMSTRKSHRLLIIFSAERKNFDVIVCFKWFIELLSN